MLVFQLQENNLEELQKEITYYYRTTNEIMLQNLFANMNRRKLKWLEHNGEHFESY